MNCKPSCLPAHLSRRRGAARTTGRPVPSVAAFPKLRGLATLRERVADDGGELTVEQKNGRFPTAAAFPHAEPDAAR